MVAKQINKAKLLIELKDLPIEDVVIGNPAVDEDGGIAHSVDFRWKVLPTAEQNQQAHEILAKHIYEIDYKEKRREKYPKLEEQLDALWHDIENGTLNKDGDFYKKIKEVKDSVQKS